MSSTASEHAREMAKLRWKGARPSRLAREVAERADELAPDARELLERALRRITTDRPLGGDAA
jgi:hypothetical protein